MCLCSYFTHDHFLLHQDSQCAIVIFSWNLSVKYFEKKKKFCPKFIIINKWINLNKLPFHCVQVDHQMHEALGDPWWAPRRNPHMKHRENFLCSLLHSEKQKASQSAGERSIPAWAGKIGLLCAIRNHLARYRLYWILSEQHMMWIFKIQFNYRILILVQATVSVSPTTLDSTCS